MRIQPAVVVSAAVAFAGVWLGVERAAAAQAHGAPRLELVAPPTCPSEATFRDEVGLLTGVPGDPFNSRSKDVLRVVITKTAAGYHGIVQFFPAGEEPWPAQEKDHRLCELLFRWAPRLASMHVPDPAAVTPQLPPPSTPPSPGEPPAPDGPDPATTADGPAPPLPKPAPLPVVPDVARPAGPAPSPLSRAFMDVTILVSAGALLTAGLTDTVGAGVQLGGEVRTERFSLGLEFRTSFPQTVVARQPVNPAWPAYPVKFDYTQGSASLVPCFRFATYFGGCAVLAGLLQVTQDYYATEIDPNFGVGPRFTAELPLGEQFALFGYAEALFTPQPHPGQGYPGKSQNVLWQPSIVSGFFGLGASVKFK